MGRVSFVSIAMTTVGPYGIDVSAERVSAGRSRISRAASKALVATIACRARSSRSSPPER